MSYTTKFELSENQVKLLRKWEKKMDKKYKNNNYTQWIMFSHSSGIGEAVQVKRKYSDTNIKEKLDLTDFSTW
jgi:hypothetical protein